LLAYPNSYFSVGISQPTVTAIKFQWSNDDIDQLMYEDDLSYEIKGDGSVPYLSGSIMERITDLDSGKYRTYDTDHGGIIGHHNEKQPSVNSGADNSLDWIVQVLSDQTPVNNGGAFRSDGYIVIRIACPVDATISYGGENLSSNLAELSTQSSFGRMDILGISDDIKMFCLYDEDDYGIALQGIGTGTMSYTIRLFNADGVLQDERIADNVPITENTYITTSTDFSQQISLLVDSDGDGITDDTLIVRPVADNGIGTGGNTGAGGNDTTIVPPTGDSAHVLGLVGLACLVFGCFALMVWHASDKKRWRRLPNRPHSR
jgi:hypothetical protein